MALHRIEYGLDGQIVVVNQRAFRNADFSATIALDDVPELVIPDGFIEFDPTVEVDLASHRTAQLSAINLAYEQEFTAIKTQYPEAERESWPVQLREAALLESDPQAVTPFLDALLVARGFGETKSELAAKVQAKNATYSALSAGLTGRRHALERQLTQATTLEAVRSVVWSTPA